MNHGEFSNGTSVHGDSALTFQITGLHKSWTRSSRTLLILLIPQMLSNNIRRIFILSFDFMPANLLQMFAYLLDLPTLLCEIRTSASYNRLVYQLLPVTY